MITEMEARHLCAMVRTANNGSASNCLAQACGDRLLEVAPYLGTPDECPEDVAIVADALDVIRSAHGRRLIEGARAAAAAEPDDEEHACCHWCGDPCEVGELTCAACARGEYDDGSEA